MEVNALQQMLSRLRQVQEDLQRQVNTVAIETSAGGGMVTVKMNGQKQVIEVKIEPEVFVGKDVDLLQDLIRAADRRNSVGNDNRGPLTHDMAEPRENLVQVLQFPVQLRFSSAGIGFFLLARSRSSASCASSNCSMMATAPLPSFPP